MTSSDFFSCYSFPEVTCSEQPKSICGTVLFTSLSQAFSHKVTLCSPRSYPPVPQSAYLPFAILSKADCILFVRAILRPAGPWKSLPFSITQRTESKHLDSTIHLGVIHKNKKQATHLPIHRCMDKQNAVCGITEFHSVMKINEFLTYVAAWVNLEFEVK